MNAHKKNLRICTVLLSCLIGLVQVSGAQTVSEYADTWHSEDLDANNNLTIYGYGSATTDGDRWLRLQVRIWSPTGQSVAFGGANGYYFVETTISTVLGYSSPQGSYDTIAVVDYDFVHYACATKSMLFGAGTFTYRQDYVIDANYAYYVRCNSGNLCQQMRVRKDKIQPPQPTWPLYISMRTIRVGSNQTWVCFGVDPSVRDSCVPDGQ